MPASCAALRRTAAVRPCGDQRGRQADIRRRDDTFIRARIWGGWTSDATLHGTCDVGGALPRDSYRKAVPVRARRFVSNSVPPRAEPTMRISQRSWKLNAEAGSNARRRGPAVPVARVHGL